MALPYSEIVAQLQQQFPDGIVSADDTTLLQPAVTVNPLRLADICLWLRDTPTLYFDHLACLSGVDRGADANTMQVVYHLSSLTQGHQLVLKVDTMRPTSVPVSDEEMPRVPSVCQVWRAAEWHEREAYDLLGIYFQGHPDMRRMLLPADWQGHPLRKDYEAPEDYHNIQIAY